MLACGCYVGLDGVADETTASSGGEDPPEPAESEGGELGDCDPTAVGSSTLRRLNRREYRNTVRDLLGLAQLPELALPWDNLNSDGFDNDGATLTLDLGAAAQYYDAAEAIVGAGATPLRECADLSGDALSACVDAGLHAWLRTAFRHPPSDEAVGGLRVLLAGQETYDEMRETIIVFTLTSPHFLFHYKSTAAREDGVVDGYEVADRLAYLVWSSGPDDELLDAAESGALAEAAGLEAQVERLLADSRSERFYTDFPTLWLKLALLQEKPDAATHGELFDDMRHETVAFFERVAKSSAPVGALLDDDRSLLDGRLADHYGVDVDLGDGEWELVELPPERSGLLTHGSVLVASSGAGFSDPIRRGSWVAQQIACLSPPPPPFEPPPLPDPEDVGASTVREVLEEHRADPTCAACHALIDPYGLALESYDHLGLHRTAYDSGEPIDPSGQLASGIAFSDAIDLSRKLAQEDDFERCVASFLSSYGVGRRLTDDDACFVELALAQAHARSETVSVDDLLVAFVRSHLFAATGGVE
jgi:hypothetical protein